MKTKVQNGATNVGLFLAHALELEIEAADRYDELADSMEAHNNVEVAKLFRDLAGYSKKHAEEVRQIAAEHGPLPKVAPWEFQWDATKESPEAAAFESAHYLMKPHHALKMALISENQGNKYYASVAAETKDPEVARLARARHAGPPVAGTLPGPEGRLGRRSRSAEHFGLRPILGRW